jgi:hypothetical protein
MSQELLRLIMALLATALLIREARRAVPSSRRRLAFYLGAGGFGLLAAGNLLTTLALGGQALIVGVTSLGIALLLGSLVTLFLAYRAGEMSEQVRRASDYVAAERAKREALDHDIRESASREKHESETRESETREG